MIDRKALRDAAESVRVQMVGLPGVGVMTVDHRDIITLLDALDGAEHRERLLVERLEREINERAVVETNYRHMVEHAADAKLDGYRELGARAAAAESAHDLTRARLARVTAALRELCAEAYDERVGGTYAFDAARLAARKVLDEEGST